MRCVATVVNLTFDGHLAVFDARRTITDLVIGDSHQEGAIPGLPKSSRPVSVDIEAEKTQIVASDHGWLVSHELAESEDHYVDALASQLTRGYPAFRDLSLRSAKLHSAWIEPAEAGWTGLLQRYRKAFMADYKLARKADDFSQLFDFEGKDFHGSATTGPMAKEQLVREYLKFGSEPGLPQYFLFADVGYHAGADQGCNPDELKDLLVRGFRYGASVAEDLSAQFQEGSFNDSNT